MSRLPLPRSFYARFVVDVARDLVGKLLLRRTRYGLCIGRIVEVEAYLAQHDSACHSYRGPTGKNASMFGPPGRAYVYPIHARYCLNAVTEPEGTASAVLIRAIEPLEGLRQMQRRRGTDSIRDTARGPARLCEAIQVGRSLDDWDLTVGRRLWLASDSEVAETAPQIGTSSRIGVTSAKDLPLRFFVDGNRFVSGPARFHSERPG